MPCNTTTVKKIPILETHLENLINSLKKELEQSFIVNGLSHSETLAISQKLDKYITEYQYLKLGIQRNKST